MEQEPQTVSRREFLQESGTVLAGMAASSALGLAAPASAGADDRTTDVKVPDGVLGRTGVRVSRLGIGCEPFKHAHVGVDDVRKTLLRALELGVNYLDVAPTYGDAKRGGTSEVKMGPTIAEIRDRVFLVTKTEEPTYEGTWRLLRQSLKALHTDRIDLIHLHNIGDESRFSDLDMVLGPKGALGALREAKKQGVIRFIGASGHLHPSRYHAVLDTGEIDVLMNAVNFVAQHTYDFEHKVWARAREENLGLVAMKVLGGTSHERKGYRLPEEFYERAIRYALSLPGLSVAVIGLENVSELERAATTVATARPLSAEEAHSLSRAGLELAGQDIWQAPHGLPVT